LRIKNIPLWLKALSKRSKINDEEKKFANCLLIYLFTARQKAVDFKKDICSQMGEHSLGCKLAKEEITKLSIKNFDECLISSNWDGGKYFRYVSVHQLFRVIRCQY